MTATSPVAQALADAFLAAPAWSTDALVAAGGHVLGGRRRWLVALVPEVLETFPRPPRDAPRALGLHVAASPAFVRAEGRARRRGQPLRARRHPVVPTRAGRVPWPTAPVDDVAGLAGLLGVDVPHLDWLADPRLLQRRAPAGDLHVYRHRWLTRPGRTPRLLEVPRPRLRRLQRAVLDQLLAPVPVHDAAHGFVAGRSALTGARVHLRSEVVITCDLTSFFAGVPVARVYALLRTLGHPEAVAHTLAALCTHAVPVRVLSGMPPGGSPDDRAALRRRLARPHLPQGAPSSPHLANLCAYRLDVRLDAYARSVGARYTRYADDLALSGGPGLARRAAAVVTGVGRVARDEGYRLNPAKTRVQHRSRRQSVTGVVVNEVPGTGRREADALRALLHNCVVLGPASQDRDGLGERFREVLEGRVGWVEHVSPARGRRLREELDRIHW